MTAIFGKSIQGLKLVIIDVNNDGVIHYVKDNNMLFLPVEFYDRNGISISVDDVKISKSPKAESLRRFCYDSDPPIGYISETVLHGNYELLLSNGVKPAYCIAYSLFYEDVNPLLSKIDDLIKKMS